MQSFSLPGDTSQRVSSTLSILLISLVSLGIAWYAAVTSERIKDEVEHSAVVRLELRSGTVSEKSVRTK